MRYFLNLILFLIVICVGNESLANPPIVLKGAVSVDQETAIRDITASNIAMRSL